MNKRLHSIVEVTNDGIWLSGKIGERPFAIMVSDNESYQNVEIGGSALFELGCHMDKGVDGMFLRPSLSPHRLGWYEKHHLHRLLHFAASIPDADVWRQRFDEAGLFQGGQTDEFGELPFGPHGLS